MNTYYIKECNSDMTYMELRILMYIDCEEKYKKITEILNFLKTHHFITHLTTLYSEGMGAENITERKDIMSLTIDAPHEKMRFKFWNGASTMWLFHSADLFDSISMGREKFSELYDRYEPVTEVLFDFKKRWHTSIDNISYEYSSDSDVDIVYNIVFTQEVKESGFDTKLIEKINKEIIMLGHEVIDDLSFEIKHSFKSIGCSPCEQARKEREKNENNKKTD